VVKATAKARKPRALVTGGGFLGRHLCERLLSEGYRVLCMDNLRTGCFENVAHLLEGEPDFEYIDHDVSTHINIPGELDEIYHLASPASPKGFSRIPIPILKVGALGTHNSLGLAHLKGARFMLAS
jgi:dTDP-glucose 4,6-dehydratase